MIPFSIKALVVFLFLAACQSFGLLPSWLSLAEMEDALASQLVPADEAAEAAGAAPTTPKPTAAAGRMVAGHQTCCFLCQGGSGNFTKHKGHYFCDPLCHKAVLCHERQLTLLHDVGQARQQDDVMRKDRPQEWRELVMPLLTTEANEWRPSSLLRAHLENLTKLSYVDRYEQKGKTLMTKSRFKAFMKREEEYGDTSASESFHRRLGEASSQNCCSSDSDKPQVKVRENQAIRETKGTRTEVRHKRKNCTSRDSGRRRRVASPDAPRDGGSVLISSRRGRSRSRRRRDSCPSSASKSRRHDSGSPAASPVSASASAAGATAATAGNNRSVPSRSAVASAGFAKPRRRCSTKAQQAPSASSLRRAATLIDLDTQPDGEPDTDPNEGLDFVKKVKAHKKDLQALIKNYSLKSHCISQLKVVCGSLDPTQVAALAKHGDHAAITGKADVKITELQDLLKKLDKLDVSELPDWEAKQTQLINELNAESGKADKLRATAKELKMQRADEKRSEKNAEFYLKRKNSDKCVKLLECGKEMAAAIASMWREVELQGQPGVVVDEGGLNGGCPWCGLMRVRGARRSLQR